MKNRRIRVLLLAEACNPEWTSVPLLAYNWYRALCKRVDVTLVTQIRNKPAFERCGETNNVVFIDSEPIAAPLHKLGRILTFGHPTALGLRGALSIPAYYYYEHLVWKRFRQKLRRGDFDIVHRLTPLSPTFPSPIASCCPIPFVIGPLNGSLPWPRGTEAIRAREGERLSHFRSIYRILPYWRQTFTRASIVIAAGRHVIQDLPSEARCRCAVLPENGVDTNRFSPNGAPPIGERHPFTILFVGRLIPLKQPAFILEALAQTCIRHDQVQVIYVGEGPEDANIRTTAERLGITNQVKLLGHVAHNDLPQLYRNASVLALPSVHESGGAVLLEAMACGLPCLVINHGGPSDYLDANVGIKVCLGTHSSMITAFSIAITRLFSDPQLRTRFAISASRHTEQHYSWHTKAEKLVVLYRSAIITPTPII